MEKEKSKYQDVWKTIAKQKVHMKNVILFPLHSIKICEKNRKFSWLLY